MTATSTSASRTSTYCCPPFQPNPHPDFPNPTSPRPRRPPQPSTAQALTPLKGQLCPWSPCQFCCCFSSLGLCPPNHPTVLPVALGNK